MKKTLEDHITNLAQVMHEQFAKVGSQFVEVHRRLDLQTEEMRQFRQTVMGWSKGLDEKVTKLGGTVAGHDTALENLQKAVGQK